MNKDETSLEAIEQAIAGLEKIKEAILAKMPLSSRVKKGDWVINKESNTHYQYMQCYRDNDDFQCVNLRRHGGNNKFYLHELNRDFKLATPTQVENHLRYLNSRGLTYDGKPISDSSGSLNSVPANTLGEVPSKKAVADYCLKQLEKLKQTQIPEFYMITVEGKNGAIVRHSDFQTAATEATRLAKKCNHRAHIMGFVAIVDVEKTESFEYKLIKK